MTKQVPGFISGNKLDNAFRQDIGLNHIPEYFEGQIRAYRRWLYNSRHAGNYTRGQLFKHPPDWKVKGVNMYGNTMARYTNMLPYKSAIAGKLFCVAFYMIR